MPFMIGDNRVTGVYVGDTPADQVFLGEVEVWRRLPLEIVLTSSGSYTSPEWAQFVDVIAIGSGAGGEGGGWFIAGRGGSSGSWSAATWTLEGPTSITAGVPAGGSPGAGGVSPSRGGDGASATVAAAGQTTITAAGGLNYQYSDQHGGGAPPFTFNGWSHPGGANVYSGSNGSTPGGGAAGGNTSSSGGTGAPAAVLLRFRAY